MSKYFYKVTELVEQTVKEITYIVEASDSEDAEEYVRCNRDDLYPISVMGPYDFGKPKIAGSTKAYSDDVKKYLIGVDGERSNQG